MMFWLYDSYWSIRVWFERKRLARARRLFSKYVACELPAISHHRCDDGAVFNGPPEVCRNCARLARPEPAA